MGAFIEKKTDRGRTALHVAAAEGHEELVTFLLETVHDQAPLDGEGAPLMNHVRLRMLFSDLVGRFL